MNLHATSRMLARAAAIVMVHVVGISQETAGMLAEMERGFVIISLRIGSVVSISTVAAWSVGTDKGILSGILFLVLFVPDEGPRSR